MRSSLTITIILAAALGGCGPGGGTPAGGGAKQAPAFSLAWSEYPSWSVFGVAHERGLIDGAKGAQGPVEKKHGVDIVLHEADYDTCITMYGAGAVDAVCIPNMDVLNPSITRASVAVMPTSRSHGADALVVVGIPDADALAGHKVYGLEKSVSEYCFVRNLRELGKDPARYDFVNMDPGAAAAAMQSGQKDVRAIMVWNPFVMQTLEVRKDARRLFDSTSIPGEIVDMVVVGRDALDRPGGSAFARATAEAFYSVCRQLEAPSTRESTLVALGSKFSSLDAASMAKVCEETIFYATPGAAAALFEGDELRRTMATVVEFCLGAGIVERLPVIEYGPGPGRADLRFDPSHLRSAGAEGG